MYSVDCGYIALVMIKKGYRKKGIGRHVVGGIEEELRRME